METVAQGAIWVKNFKLRQSISNFIATRALECPRCKHHYQDDLSETQEDSLNETITNHVMKVKIRSMREKYIAIYNPKASLPTHPNYFLYVYQAFTGAPAVYPFTSKEPFGTSRTFESKPGQTGFDETPCPPTGTHQSKTYDTKGQVS